VRQHLVSRSAAMGGVGELQAAAAVAVGIYLLVV
jgi:hypothetical protein